MDLQDEPNSEPELKVPLCPLFRLPGSGELLMLSAHLIPNRGCPKLLIVHEDGNDIGKSVYEKAQASRDTPTIFHNRLG